MIARPVGMKPDAKVLIKRLAVKLEREDLQIATRDRQVKQMRREVAIERLLGRV